MLSKISVHAWLQEHGIKTERGENLDFKDHPFLFDIYSDLSPLQVIMKPAQVGLTLLQMVKLFWVVWAYKLEVIYTMPTDSDVSTFVGARLNSLIRQNAVMQTLTQDRDTIETKKIGESMVYFKGTWTKKAAISVPADLLVHDELDASNLQIIEDYETRLRHSKFKWRWLFSHPSYEGVGAHKYWQLSDQKHWFITCGHCKKEQYLDWPDSICFEREAYVCKYCDEILTDDMRRHGRWVAKYRDKEWSGYWINSLMCIWISAKEIISNYYTKDQEYFFTKVLGLPYIGEGNKIPESHFTKNLIDEPFDIQDERVIIGLDTGTTLWYTCGTRNGVFKWGHASGYEEIEDLLKRYPRSVLVCDQGGDLIAPRKLREKYQGRVFLCHYEKDKKTMQLIRWGDKKEAGNVKVDRNRMISVIVGELDDCRLTLYGTKEYWQTLIDHAANMYREKEENEALGTFEYRWKRSGDDHLMHALLYMRVGMDKFAQGYGMIIGENDPIPTGVTLDAKGRIPSPLNRGIM